MITYALVAVVFVVFALALLCFRSALSPAVMHSGMWLMILLLHATVDHGLYELSHLALMVVSGSVVAFFLGCIGISLFSAGRSAGMYTLVGPPGDLPLLTFFHRFYFWCALLASPFVWLKANALASHGATESFLVNLRLALISEDIGGSYGVLAYFLLVAFSGLFLRLVDSNSRVLSLGTAVYFLLCAYYATMATGRTFFFLLLLPAGVLLLMSRRRRGGVISYALMAALLLLVFLLLGVLMGRAGEDAQDALQIFWLYLLGGITAFDHVLNNVAGGDDLGSNTFRSVLAVLLALGFDLDAPALIKEYVHIPVPTNVYTVFHPYYLDFGVAFLFFFQFLFGALHQFLYGKARSGSRWGMLIFAVSVYPLLMQWFQDQYFSLATTFFVFFVLLTAPFFKVGNRFLYAPSKS